jgi:predicted phage terminase large subunit-like protein
MIIESFSKEEYFPNTIVANATKEIIQKTIYENPYVYLKPYPRQLWPLFEVTQPNYNDEPHSVLVGGGGYGGKTILGSIAAAQYLQFPNYQCLITRKNRKELIGPNSIWRNLKEWLTRPELGSLRLDPRTDINKSELMMKAPSGATLWFKFFDEEDSKQKLKSESYDRIVHDEASELRKRILQFSFRSLRNAADSHIPLSMLNFSNPGGPATDYLTEEYVDGDLSYYLMDWQHNPFIVKSIYAKTLDKLDFIDQKYQKEGDWHYKPAKGDLFPEAKLRSIIIDNLPDVQYIRNVRGIDMAISKTGDYTAFVKWLQDSRMHKYIVDVQRIKTEYPEDELIRIIDEDNKHWKEYEFDTEYIFERQPADSGVHQERYIQSELADYLDHGLFYDYVRHSTNKFTRARPFARAVKNDEVSILKADWNEEFINELKDFGPDPKEYEYDDQTDAASIGFNKLGGIESLKIYM